VSNPSVGNGDTPELEELFESIAHQVSSAPVQAVPGPDDAVSVASLPDQVADSQPIYDQVGLVTRKLHDAIADMEHDEALERIARAIPDARDRLNYIATLTRNAAEHVLDATDVARPLQDAMHDQARALLADWDRLFRGHMAVDEFKLMVRDTRAFLANVPARTQETSDQLMKMVMAQDFQDLTGQVIKKMNVIVKEIEQDLVNILINCSPGEMAAEAFSFERTVPGQDSPGAAVSGQQQVDDMLDRLGF
jgi:chemotaxis protein CheZ